MSEGAGPGAPAAGFGAVLDSEAELEALIGTPRGLSPHKVLPALDEHCRDFLARCPFAVLATADAEGRVDASPRGGPPGFLVVLDDHRLAFADYGGNKLAESSRNLLATGRAHLLCLLPGVGETLRVEGRGVLSTDPDLLAQLPVGGRERPPLAVGLEVERAYLHCAKALLRSQLWDPAAWPSTEGMTPTTRMLRDHVARTKGELTEADVATRLEQSYSDLS